MPTPDCGAEAPLPAHGRSTPQRESERGADWVSQRSMGIVAQAGGIVEVESELGIGTTFIIHLPAAGQGAFPTAASGERSSIPADVVS